MKKILASALVLTFAFSNSALAVDSAMTGTVKTAPVVKTEVKTDTTMNDVTKMKTQVKKVMVPAVDYKSWIGQMVEVKKGNKVNIRMNSSKGKVKKVAKDGETYKVLDVMGSWLVIDLGDGKKYVISGKYMKPATN